MIKTTEMKTTHVGLVRMNGNKIIGVQYLNSKFERELGDVMRIENVEWKVGIIGDDKDSVIQGLNIVIRKQNSIIRKLQKQQNKKADKIFDDLLRQAWKDINNEYY